MINLYTYFRSSAAYRVRIALNLKQVSYRSIPIHLLKGGGEQFSAEYTLKNPQQLVPTLESNNLTLTQSLAIIEYLDEEYPEHPLLPGNTSDRAFVRSIAHAIACDIHPLNNLRVLQYLQNQLGFNESQKNTWYLHWLNKGLNAVECLLSQQIEPSIYCFGETPTLADCVLIPQLYNAKRFNCDTSQYPRISSIELQCEKLDAFKLAIPENQLDAQ